MESLEQRTIDEWKPECPEDKLTMDSRCGGCSSGWSCIRTSRRNSKLLDDSK